MTSFTNNFRPNVRLIAAGAALTGIGTVVAATGAALVGLALATAGRRWSQTWETPPAELAQRTYNQAKTASQAASQAGLAAWRNGAPSMN